MNEQDIVKTLKEEGKTAPSVTPEMIDENIVDIEIVKHVSKSGKILRWALLTTKSGYTATGNPSVSVSPENDIPKVGESVAIANARRELWPAMGYHLSCQLAGL